MLVEAAAMPNQISSPDALFVFRCRTRMYALPVSAVDAVIDSGPLVRLPLAPPRIIGLCAHRRQVLPVFLLAESGAGSKTGDQVVVLLRSEQGTWGLQADRAGVTVVEGRVIPAGADGPGAVGTLAHEGHSVVVLDPETAWLALREEVEQWYAQARGRYGAEAAPPRNNLVIPECRG